MTGVVPLGEDVIADDGGGECCPGTLCGELFRHGERVTWARDETGAIRRWHQKCLPAQTKSATGMTKRICVQE